MSDAAGILDPFGYDKVYDYKNKNDCRILGDMADFVGDIEGADGAAPTVPSLPGHGVVIVDVSPAPQVGNDVLEDIEKDSFVGSKEVFWRMEIFLGLLGMSREILPLLVSLGM